MDLQNEYKVVYEANKPDSAQPNAPLYATKEKSGATAITDPYVISTTDGTASGYIDLKEKKYFLHDNGKKLFAREVKEDGTIEEKQFCFISSTGEIIAGEKPSNTAK